MRQGLLWGLVLSIALAFGVVGCSDDDGGTSTAGSGGSAGTAGTGGMAGSGGMTGVGGEGGTGGGMPSEIHGCTFDDAMDMTGMATVSITDIAAWVVVHDVCVRVSAGTEVVWENSNFTAHPLIGGISATPDPSSPITQAGAVGMVGDAEVTLSDEGTYPYYCEVHFNTMTGVIYVVP